MGDQTGPRNFELETRDSVWRLKCGFCPQVSGNRNLNFELETYLYMYDPDKYLNDPSFMKWVFCPDQETERYWNKYLEDHPEEKEPVLLMREELSGLKLKNEDLGDDEKKTLLQSLLKEKDKGRALSLTKVLKSPVLRYAAVALIFLALGNLLPVFVSEDRQEEPSAYSVLTDRTPVDQPVIRLADGRQIMLTRNSVIEYLAENRLTVDGREIKLAPAEGYDRVDIPRGYRSKLILSDKSVVWLNSGSRLVYSPAFQNDRREVMLSGEAFFEVSKNPDARFIVQTTAIAVEVFGTKFNVTAYEDEPVIRTVLVEGEVAVRRNDPGLGENQIRMKPDQMVSYDRQTQNFETIRVDTGFYTLWKQGMIKFENEPLSNLTHKLERYYNMTVIFRDKNKSQVRISGKLDLNGDKFQIMEYLETLTGMHFNKLNETYYVMD